MTATTQRKGPIESRPWPEAIDAFVVDSSAEPRIHGFDVESDLAAHYRFSDVAFLALVGRLPDDEQSRAFEIALCFLAPLSVGAAAGHAAVLAGFCGAPPSGVLATSAVTIADSARDRIEAVLALSADADLPSALRASTDAERAAVGRLRARLQGVVDVPRLAHDPSRDVALIEVLRACGLTTALQLTAAVTVGRLPCAVAEAGHRSSAEFVEKYPMNTPPFVYEADE